MTIGVLRQFMLRPEPKVRSLVWFGAVLNKEEREYLDEKLGGPEWFREQLQARIAQGRPHADKVEDTGPSIAHRTGMWVGTQITLAERAYLKENLGGVDWLKQQLHAKMDEEAQSPQAPRPRD